MQTVTLHLPDDVAQSLSAEWSDLPRAALEGLALEAYRRRRLSTEQIRTLLGFETRHELDGFLKRHAVWLDYGVADLEQDRETHIRLGLSS